jgi:hypothetical protein
MKRYDLADLLPRKWRQVMAEGGPYAATWPFDEEPDWPAPRNDGGYCPLGVLSAAGLVQYDPDADREPTATRAAQALADALGQRKDLLFDAVTDFVTSWDRGEIADLAAALGL